MLDLPLHHIGVATHDIAREERIFSSLGYAPCSEVFIDQAQGVRGRFMAASNQPTIELLENINKIKNGGGVSLIPF
jgi:methylmalonyl-CoA/ethylmalonyl-CoA epimerase